MKDPKAVPTQDASGSPTRAVTLARALASRDSFQADLADLISLRAAVIRKAIEQDGQPAAEHLVDVVLTWRSQEPVSSSSADRIAAGVLDEIRDARRVDISTLETDGTTRSRP